MANTSATLYQTNAKVAVEPADTLVVYCSDHRFQAGIHEFLDDGLRLSHNYDLLAIPGGPQSLTLVEYLPKFSWAGWKWFRYLVDTHDLKRLILIAHKNCLWYESLPLHLHTSPEPRARQEQDLRRVRRKLAEEFAHLSVEAYYAGIGADGRMTVEPVAS